MRMKSFTKFLHRKGRPHTMGAKVAGAALFCLFAALIGLCLGSTRLDLAAALRAAVASDTANPDFRILLFVRLPRTLSALICGAALSVAGTVIQGVLSNRLASPSVIGVNAGAGLAVTLCAALGLYGGLVTSLFAFVGAVGAVALISLGAQKWGASRGTVVLMGVALSALLGAISDTVLAIDPNVAALTSDFKIGTLSGVTYARLIPAALLTAGGMFVLLSLSSELDVLSLGEDTARGLGMKTGRMRALLLIFAALLSGCAVSLAGLLSFVGLLVPHAVRRLYGSSARELLPLCALVGAGFVALCDTLARLLFAPHELPVGIVMAFLGAPFFVFVLIKGKGGHHHA